MANLARQEMYFRQFFTVEEIIARIDEVTAAQVQAMAQRLFDPRPIAVTLLGRLDGVKLKRDTAGVLKSSWLAVVGSCSVNRSRSGALRSTRAGHRGR